MVAQGQTVFLFAGDFGAYADQSTLSVYDPASRPLVTAVGGTTLSVSVSGGGVCTYVSETVWNDGESTPATLNAGGGGISTIWPLPYWQAAIARTNEASFTNRNVPDVSLNANNEGTATTPSASFYFEGSLMCGGRTSFASPLWAAFTALVNEARAGNSLPPLGSPICRPS